MFNNKKMENLNNRMVLFDKKLEEMETELRRVSRENEALLEKMFNLEYPNGKLIFKRTSQYSYGHGYTITFCYNKNKYMGIATISSYPCIKNIERLEENKYLIQLDSLYFLVNTSTNQSIRVDKDMKVML